MLGRKKHHHTCIHDLCLDPGIPMNFQWSRNLTWPPQRLVWFQTSASLGGHKTIGAFSHFQYYTDWSDMGKLTQFPVSKISKEWLRKKHIAKEVMNFFKCNLTKQLLQKNKAKWKQEGWKLSNHLLLEPVSSSVGIRILQRFPHPLNSPKRAAMWSVTNWTERKQRAEPFLWRWWPCLETITPFGGTQLYLNKSCKYNIIHTHIYYK